MEVGFGVSGFVIALLLWHLGQSLEPDTRGRALGSLPSWFQWSLFVVVVVLSSVGTALAVSAVGHRPSAIAFGLLASASPVLAVIDSTTHRIPYLASGTLIVAGMVCFWWDAVVTGDAAALERAAWAAVVVGAFGLALWLPARGLGPGDVGLLVVLGGYAGWLSWPLVWWGVGLGSLSAVVGICGALLLRRWNGLLPYGAYLLTGWWTAFILADWVRQLH